MDNMAWRIFMQTSSKGSLSAAASGDELQPPEYHNVCCDDFMMYA